MITMQDMILKEFNEVAQTYELKAVISKKASNTGVLHVMDGFHNVLMMKFSFQTTYCSLDIHDENDKKLDHMSNGFLEYKKSKELKKFMDNVDSYCREYDMEKAGVMED